MTDGQLRYQGRMDVTITANQNNWAPVDDTLTPLGIGTSTSIYIDANGDYSITGINAEAFAGNGNAGERGIFLHNATTTRTISFVGLSGSSSAANQFGWSGTISLGRGETLALKYDATDSLWRLNPGRVSSGATPPGGSTTQVQFNNAGSFDGDSNLTWDDTNAQLTSTHLKVSGTTSISGDVSVTVSSNQNNWNPAGLATAGVLRINPDTATISITGILAPSAPFNDGRVLILHNVGTGGFNINLIDSSGSSDPANTFLINGNTSIKQNHSAVLQYDSVSTRWRLIGLMGSVTHTHQSSVEGNTLDASAVFTGGTAVPVTRGGTALTTVASGSMLYASAADTISALAAGSARALLRMNSGGTAPEWKSPTYSRSVTITDPAASDDATLFFTPVAITVTDVRSHITGSTNVVFNISHAATRTGTPLDVFTSDITLTSTAGQSNSAGFNDNTIPANSWVWLDVVSVSGSPTMFHATVIFTED